MELIFHKSEKYIEEDIFYYISDQRDKHSMIKPKKEDLISMTVESENLSGAKEKQISNVLYPFKKNSIDKIYIGLSFPLFSNNWAASYLRYLLKIIKTDGAIILPVYPEEQANEKGMWSRSFLENIFTSRTGWTGRNNVWAENDGVMSMRIGKKFPDKINSTLNFYLEEIGNKNFRNNLESKKIDYVDTVKNIWLTSKFSSIIEKIIQDNFSGKHITYCDLGNNPSLPFEINVSSYIKVKKTIIATNNDDAFLDLNNYFSYRKSPETERLDIADIKNIASHNPDIISTVFNSDNLKLLNNMIEICPKAAIVFYGKLDISKEIYGNYNICNYSSIVATKLNSGKTINHYSDIIEEEINKEEECDDNKIYLLIPK